MTLEEEKNLVEKAKKDEQVFGLLYDEYYPRIFGYVLRRTADLDVTQDVVSETFLKALKNLGKFRWQNVAFGSWLYRIASNEIVNFFRKKKPTVSLDKISDPASSSNHLQEIIQAQEKLAEHQDFLVIQKQISSLDVKYQEVINLRFFEKKQIKEIAQILGKNEGTIKSLLHRGLEKLRKLGQLN
jgi:RNA polymerase sigma-70 factor (ECF subfamily)